MGLELQCVWAKRVISIVSTSHIIIFMPKVILQLNHENLSLCQIQLNLAYHSPNHSSCLSETPFCPRWLFFRDTILPTTETRERASAMGVCACACTYIHMRTHLHPIKVSLLMGWLLNKDRMKKVVKLKFPRKMSRVVQFFQENGSLACTAHS